MFLLICYLFLCVCLETAECKPRRVKTNTQHCHTISFWFFLVFLWCSSPINSSNTKTTTEKTQEREKKTSPTFSVQTNIFTEHKLHNILVRTHNTQRCRRIDRLVFSCRNKSILSSSRIQWLHCCQLQLHGPSMFMFGSLSLCR